MYKSEIVFESSPTQAKLEELLETNLEIIKDIAAEKHVNPVSLANEIWPLYYMANPNLCEDTIKDSIQYAQFYHKDQWRDSGNPFILHPLQVSYFMAFNQMPDEPVQGGLLHDVKEKNSDKWHMLGNSIYSRFGELVSLYVSAMSTKNKPKNNDIDTATLEKKQRITDFSQKFGLDCMIVLKLGDNIMNMRSRKYLPAKYGMDAKEFQNSQLNASKKHYRPLAKEIDGLRMLPMEITPYLDKVYKKY